MAKQKNDQPDKAPQEGGMVQTVLSQYRQIAKNLHKSRNDEAILNALSPVLDMPQDAQIRLLKALGKEQRTEAADVALAINTYASVKEVRKEARRTLIHLEGSDVYPDWQLPSLVSLSDIVNTATQNVFEEDDELGDDEDEEDMYEGENVIERFLRYWAQKDFALAFDLLTTDSPLREGLARDVWVERREAWAANADFDSTTMKVDVGYTLAFEEDDELGDDEEELDAFWSLEMKNVVSSGSMTLPELPLATLSLPTTRRHWFWSSYSFREEDGEYRIVSMNDKGAAALQLSEDEVHKRYQEISEEIGAMLAPQAEGAESNDEEQSGEPIEIEIDFDEVRWFIQQSLHYFDNLIASNTTEQDIYLVQAKQAQAVPDYERSAAYSLLGAERLRDVRGDMLALLGGAYSELAIGDEEEEDEEDDLIGEASRDRYYALAEDAFRQAIGLQDTVSNRLLLIDLLLNRDDRLDDAAHLLIEAREHIASPADEGTIETRVAQLLIIQEKPGEALTHFQKAASLAPDIESIWYDIALVQLSLNQRAAAEESFLKSIELQPTIAGAYADLATQYVEEGKDEEAINMLNAGIQANPEEVDLMAALSMVYISMGDLDTAEEIIEGAEAIDPSNEIVQVAREVVAMQRLQQQQQHSNKKSGKSKKRR